MFLKLMAPLLFAALLAAVNAGMVGNPRPADANDPDIQEALQFAVEQHNHRTNDIYLSRVSKVIDVKSQVVSGVKYIFTIELARTSCRKGANECVDDSDPAATQVQECKFAVWSQPWLNSRKLVDNTCV